ncbi:LGFP repeat-containing protein [Nocardia jiangxiensis]|uniref:LGFP repeat-containing protein n=1 Tax=Nocardia jiangxiensis TaxID=282685 RepID=UPI001FE06883|nr:esterase [Nocardia jiangxiensis]
MDMHHFARRSAAMTMTLAAAGLLFTAACSSNDDNNSSATTSAAAAATNAANESGANESGAKESAANETGANGAAAETKIQTPSGEITVAGHVLAKYNEMGGPAGTLGAPTGNSMNGPNGGSCQEFTGGAICWSEQTGPHAVWGDIRKAWDSNGGINGKLGYPTTDEKDIANGKQSDFTGGSITWVNNQTSVTMK